MNKIESGKLELVEENINLSELVDNIVTMSRQQIEDKHHNFTLSMNKVEHVNVIGDSMGIHQLFLPFSRAKDARVEKIQGTGLGMAITKNIVSMMNGDIKVESKLGEGTRFTVTIFLKLQKNKGKAAGKSDDVNDASNALEELQKKNFKGKRALLVGNNK